MEFEGIDGDRFGQVYEEMVMISRDDECKAVLEFILAYDLAVIFTSFVYLYLYLYYL